MTCSDLSRFPYNHHLGDVFDVLLGAANKGEREETGPDWWSWSLPSSCTSTSSYPFYHYNNNHNHSSPASDGARKGESRVGKTVFESLFQNLITSIVYVKVLIQCTVKIPYLHGSPNNCCHEYRLNTMFVSDVCFVSVLRKGAFTQTEDVLRFKTFGRNQMYCNRKNIQGVFAVHFCSI